MRHKIARKMSMSIAKLLNLNYIVYFYDASTLAGAISAKPSELGQFMFNQAYAHPALFEDVVCQAHKSGYIFQDDDLTDDSDLREEEVDFEEGEKSQDLGDGDDITDDITDDSYLEEVAEHGMD